MIPPCNEKNYGSLRAATRDADTGKRQGRFFFAKMYQEK